MMFLWLTINPGLAGMTRVNGTVVLLSAIAGLLITRSLRPSVSLELTDPRQQQQQQTVAVRVTSRRAAA
jgi:hypothetical protein